MIVKNKSKFGPRYLMVIPSINNFCDYCHDGDGGCIYPYYGLAPHNHELSITGGFMGSTVFLNKNTYPENFHEDPECEGLGTYTNCLKCGNGV